MTQFSLDPPPSSWKAPNLADLPNLRDAPLLGLDIESSDPNIKASGPGFIRGDAFPVGVSVAVPDGPSFYLPFGHSEGNLPKDNVVRYLKDNLRGGRPKVGANILYDIEGLSTLGIEVNGPWFDVQVAQPLLTEWLPGGFNLENLCKHWLDEHKETTLLDDAGRAYGFKKAIEHMAELPAKYVGPYAEIDAVQPIRIYQKQALELGKAGLTNLFTLETQLLKLIFAMRQRGIRVDLDRTHELRKELLDEETQLYVALEAEYGLEPRVWANAYLDQLAAKTGTVVEYTEKGNTSYTNEWLEAQDMPVWGQIARLRKLNKIRSTFIDNAILGYEINGRIHAQYHPLRSENYGTVSGRFSSSNPNMQQVPKRDEEFGPKMRGLFLPERGELFAALDYSGQELRLATHFAYAAKTPGSDELVYKYQEDPDLDLHQLAADMAGIERKDAKSISFAILYGAGLQRLADMLGSDKKTARTLRHKYNNALPCFSKASSIAEHTARQRGFVRTLLRRRRIFKSQRSCYKAFNAIIQGSGADMIKKAMLDVYDETKRIPLLTVHDELGYSVTDVSQAIQIAEIMENAIPGLHVPMRVEPTVGKTWGG